MTSGMRSVLAAVAGVVLAVGPVYAEPLQIGEATALNGDCKHLQVYGHDTQSPCDGLLNLYAFRNGRNGIGFKSLNGQSYYFIGPARSEISPNEDSIYLAIDGVRVAGDREGDDQKAVGVCRYENPYLGSLDILCHAETIEGSVDAEFISDGKEPGRQEAVANAAPSRSPEVCPQTFVSAWMSWNRRGRMPTPARSCLMRLPEGRGDYICSNNGCNRK